MSSASHSGRRSYTPKAAEGTHFFVSIYNDKPTTASSQEGSYEPHHSPNRHQHNHNHHRWTILVEPHRHHHLSLSFHHQTSPEEPVLFLISRDNTSSSWACHTRRPNPADDAANLVGKIHIGAAKHTTTTVQTVEELLRARLPPDGEAWPAERTSEHWVRAAVHALQESGLVERFDLDAFMTFARGYVAEREGSVGVSKEEEDLAPPVVVAFAPDVVVGGGVVGKEKHGEGGHAVAAGLKKRGRGFWLSWPHSATAGGKAREREESPYGGLM